MKVVLDVIRGKDVSMASAILKNTPKAACEYPVSYTHLDVYKRQVPSSVAQYGALDLVGTLESEEDLTSVSLAIYDENRMEAYLSIACEGQAFDLSQFNGCLLYTSLGLKDYGRGCETIADFLGLTSRRTGKEKAD